MGAVAPAARGAHSIDTMFEQLRTRFRSVLDGASSPADRRAAVAEMKDTLVRARLGVEDLRAGVDAARGRVREAQQELETIRRRRGLAEGIGDHETVAVAERFERLQAERVQVLEQKAAAQERELALLEQEVQEMGAELRRAATGVPGAVPGAAPASAHVGGVGSEGGPRDAAERAAQAEIDALLGDSGEQDAASRQRARDAREAAADARLAELKRRMGR